MTLHVRWLDKGHIQHGYRRVFVIFAESELQNVLVVNHMGYEAVFRVQELANDPQVTDPSLLWGLSIAASILESNGFADADDGYLSVRADPASVSQLLPLDVYANAVRHGELILETNDGGEITWQPST